MNALVSWLVKLRFKIEKHVAGKEKHDTALINDLILIDLSEFQVFASTNCTDISIEEEPSTLHDSTRAVERDNIDAFLETLRVFNLETDKRLDCILEPKFAENFLQSPLLSADGNINHIADAQIVPGNDELLTIKALFHIADGVINSRYVYWYEDFLLTAIIKCIFDRLVDNGKKTGNEEIKTLIDSISENRTDLPELLFNGFSIYSKMDDQYDENIKSYRRSLDSIIKHTKNNNNVVDSTDVMSLLQRVNDNLDAYKCFYRYFKYIPIGLNRYYMPLIEFENDIIFDNKSTKNDDKFAFYKLLFNFDNTCDTALRLYSICFHTLKCFDNDEENIEKVGTGNVKQSDNACKAYKLISHVMNIFFVLLNDKYERNISKVAYEGAIILVNFYHQKKTGHVHSVYLVKRYLNEIMAKLSGLTTYWCEPKLVFNSPASNTGIYKKSAIKKLLIVLNSTTFEDVSQNYTYLNILKIHDEHLANSKVVKLFKERILFNWKGKVQTIEDVYKDMTDLTLNVHHLCAFFDISFRFYAAVVHHVLGLIIDKTETVTEIGSRINVDKLNNFEIGIFPRELESIVLNIKNLIVDINNANISSKRTLSDKNKDIRKSFEGNIVFFGDTIDAQNVELIADRCFETETTTDVSDLISDECIAEINNELSSTVKPINDYFSAFKGRRVVDSPSDDINE